MRQSVTVTRTKKETPQVTTIYFRAASEFSFIAGQYVTVYVNGAQKGKAYSLSSTPGDDELSITVKNIGMYSGALCALEAGSSFELSGPYGFFNVRDDQAPIVALVAGVGIAPVWSIIRDELQKNSARNVTLLCASSRKAEIVFSGEINDLFRKSSSAVVRYFVTKEVMPGSEQRRIECGRDITPVQVETAQFYICGSEDFVRSMWRQLMEMGVDEQRIVTETFFESAV